jgi:hypothetical protein
MSFLYYDDRNPTTRATFSAVKSDAFLLRDPETGEYAPISGGGGGGGGELPSYLKPNSVEIAGAGTNTILDSNSVDVNDTAGNTGSSLTSTALTFGDSGGNNALTKTSVIAANRLATGTAAATVVNMNSEQTLLIWNNLSNAVAKSNTIQLTKSGAVEYAQLAPTSISVQNSTTGTRAYVTPQVIYNNTSTKLVASLKHGTLTCGTGVNAVESTIDTSLPYIELKADQLAFRTSSTAFNLLREDVIITNNLKALTNTTPTAPSKMVIYNTATGVYNHTALPSAAPTLPKTYFRSVTVADFPAVNASLTAFVSGQERAVKTYTFGDGERIVFDFGGATFIKYETWYVVGLAQAAPGFKSIIKATHVPYRLTDVGTTIQSCYVSGTAFTSGAFTVQPYHIAFKISKSGKTASDDFSGNIEFHKVLHDASLAPSITPT